MTDALRVFGALSPDATYIDRPGAYGVLFRDDGRVAVVRTAPGLFLVGGGMDAGENVEATLQREAREEAGLEVRIGATVGRADERAFCSSEGVHYLKRCMFVIGEAVAEHGGGEDDHELVWMWPEQAWRGLAHGSQRWAVAEAVRQRVMLHQSGEHHVRTAQEQDRRIWVRMRATLWPGSQEEHAEDVAAYLSAGWTRGLEAAFVSVAQDGRVLGFAEASVRRYAEGCATDRNAYLEGWFVVETDRRAGVGRSLVAACAAWGRALGCTEFASDAEADNDVSHRAHEALGFESLGDVRLFRMDLPRD